jgi:hypothetical protein
MTTDILSNIKASTAGKSPAQLAQMRKDLDAHIRGLAPNLTATASRFGHGGIATDMQAADNQRARLARHRAEIAYLDKLLESLDPILAAQARAGI